MPSIEFKNIDFISPRKIAYVISISAVLIALFSVTFKGLNLGLDFTGGTQIEMGFPEAIEMHRVEQALNRADLNHATVQYFGTNRDMLLRLPVTERIDPLRLKNQIIEAFRLEHQPLPEIKRIESIGAQVGDELLEKGSLAVFITLLGIASYIWLRFEQRFAIGALIATAHDPIIILGYFSVTGTDFDLTVLAAILAVVGYSVNDTVVIFDRIRENFRKMRRATPMNVINSAINQTMSRSIITSGTTLFTVIAMYFFGGPLLHGFSIALIIGILVGTYSSIFVASAVAFDLGVSRRNLLPIDKETGKPVDDA